MEITSDATRIRLATFRLEGESHIWWDWVRASRDPETMTWGEFTELFMGKFFPTSARHAKAREFLGLKQGSMTMLEYVPSSPNRHVSGMTMWQQIWLLCQIHVVSRLNKRYCYTNKNISIYFEKAV